MRLGVVAVAAVSAVFLLSACGDTGPASLEFVDINPAQPRIGDITTVRFRAVDSRGLPLEGAPVTFRLQSDMPGVVLTPTQTTTTKGNGEATTQLIASSRVSSVVVVAEAGDKVAQTPPISFAGSAPSARQLTFQCGEISGASSGGIHAIMAFDEARSLVVGVRLNCTAHVADRNGDGISGAQVSFLTEAGTIGPTSTSLSDVVGNATVLYKTSYPLPEEVDPVKFEWTPLKDATHTGEYVAPLWMEPWTWRPNPMTSTVFTREEPRRNDPVRPGHVNNPRDNLVSMIAVVSGEEAFDDLNNNGAYDNGEPFEDTTEPFVDNNDNGTWDPGERYIDENGNGKWDGANGVYDAHKLIWTQERLLWTGRPNALDYNDPEPVVQQVLPAGGGSISVPHFGSATVVVRYTDPWYNSYAQNSAGDGCHASVLGPVTSADSLTFTGYRLTYPPVREVTFGFTDTHDPNSDPPTPPFTTAVDFGANLDCEFTASPVSGFKSLIRMAVIKGSVL